MSQEREPSPAPAADTSTPAGKSEVSAAGSWKRELAQRLAQGATPHDIGVYLQTQIQVSDRHAALAFLHEQRGNGFVQQALAAKPGLSGAMLVSNNPEGLASPGAIVAARAEAGPMAAYIHHSNHTRTPLDMFMVVKPAGGAVTAGLSGASAVTGGTQRAHGGPAAWAEDPNVVVAAANEAKGDANDPNSHNRINVVKEAAGPTAIKLGTLPAGGKGDPPLFDARYDLQLSGPAELEIVAERAGGASKAVAETAPATGNTKYELPGTNGRGAGMYQGASFASDDTARVSQLPFKKPLTGSKFSSAVASPNATTAMQTVAPTDAMFAEVTQKQKISTDAAAIYVLEHVFRIAPDWLREKKVWDGTHLNANGLTEDYATVIHELQAALAKDKTEHGYAATRAVIAKHPNVGAGLDAASYGTMFDVGVLIDNDTAAPANVVLDFLTDAAANRAHHGGAVYRGMVSVDGADHAINNDTASGPRSDATLGSAQIAPEQSKYIHVQFQSPGQVSAGQELDIKKK